MPACGEIKNLKNLTDLTITKQTELVKLLASIKNIISILSIIWDFFANFPIYGQMIISIIFNCRSCSLKCLVAFLN